MGRPWAPVPPMMKIFGGIEDVIIVVNGCLMVVGVLRDLVGWFWLRSWMELHKYD